MSKQSTDSREATASAGAPNWAVESLFHFVVNASNFERSLEFYQRLGFRVLRDNRDVVWPSYVGENFGMAAAQGRGALLGLGESEHHTRLDLIEWLEPRWENPNDPPSPNQVPRVMALRTRNLRAAYEDLKSQGVEFIAAPRDPDPNTGVESVVCCRDPDGYVVELIEYIGGRLGSRVDDLETREEEKA
jgi:catechol 2,3-dioxygenase-like lactoylglutathione lyase family enzyme